MQRKRGDSMNEIPLISFLFRLVIAEYFLGISVWQRDLLFRVGYVLQCKERISICGY